MSLPCGTKSRAAPGGGSSPQRGWRLACGGVSTAGNDWREGGRRWRRRQWGWRTAAAVKQKLDRQLRVAGQLPLLQRRIVNGYGGVEQVVVFGVEACEGVGAGDLAELVAEDGDGDGTAGATAAEAAAMAAVAVAVMAAAAFTAAAVVVGVATAAVFASAAVAAAAAAVEESSNQ
jgi:hypothetical protein